jgi:hypothetical protein
MRHANTVDRQRQEGDADDGDDAGNAQQPGGAGRRIGTQRGQAGMGRGNDGRKRGRKRVENGNDVLLE